MIFRSMQFFFVVATLILLVVAIVIRKPESLLPQTLQALVQKPLAVAAISTVSLVPAGSTAVDLVVLRHGRTGPIAIELTDLPEGVTASVPPIQGEESTTRIEFTASEALGDENLEATVTVRATIAEDSTSQPFTLRVPRVGRPVFAKFDRIILKPGMQETVAVRMQRNGFDGPLRIHGVRPPTGVQLPEIELSEGASSGTLSVAVAHDAAEGSFPIALATSAYGRDVSASLPLVIDSIPYRVHSLRVVRLRPGDTAVVDVPVERNSYDGPVRLTAVGLPAHVTMPETTVPAGQKTVSIRFQADPSATPGVQSAKILARAGPFEEASVVIMRIINDTDDGFLPREIVDTDAIGWMTSVGSPGSRTSASGKKFLQRLYGSSPSAQAALASGLEWLSRVQMENGSWTLAEPAESGPSAASPSSTADDPVAATALALLPFLAEGVTHKRSSITSEHLTSYRKTVERGLQFLTRNQATPQAESNGAIGSSLMGHTLATLALAEAYGLSRDKELRPFLTQALAYLVNAQQKRAGGWREQPDGREELSTTVWDVMALRNARYAHLSVPQKVLRRTEIFLQDCGAGPPRNRRSQYANAPGDEATPTATATGLLVQQLLGCQKSEPAMHAGCQYLMAHLPPEGGGPRGDVDYYFFATQVLRNMEGDDFDLWHHLVQDHIVRGQERGGARDGSWRSPAGAGFLRDSRIYATAVSLLTLQVSYRQLPLYRPVKLKAEDAPDEDAPDDEQEDTQE